MFVCQKCNSSLDEAFVCRACGEAVAQKNGVPQFLSDHDSTDAFGLQWNAHAKAQLDSHSGQSISRDRLFGVSGWPEDLSGHKILEAGSGAGRFTEVLLATGAEVYSFDASSATLANASQHASNPRAHIFRASIYDIPMRRASFDKVICLGVLQHTSDPERSFFELASFVKPGGDLVIDVYRKNLAAMLSWKYLLRPITKRVPDALLYKMVRCIVPAMLPAATLARHLLGRVGARLFPIAQYNHLGLPDELAKEWAVLDTFDMYAPTYDKPQSVDSVRGWFKKIGFDNVVVKNGPNGVIGRGRKPNA